MNAVAVDWQVGRIALNPHIVQQIRDALGQVVENAAGHPAAADRKTVALRRLPCRDRCLYGFVDCDREHLRSY